MATAAADVLAVADRDFPRWKPDMSGLFRLRNGLRLQFRDPLLQGRWWLMLPWRMMDKF